MNRYTAVIFDLDGVLCHTDQYHYLAWKELADSLKIPFNEEINQRLRGVSRMESLEIVLENSPVPYSQEQKDAFAQQKNSRYRNLLAQMSPSDVSHEVLETLEELRARGIRLAVGSSSRNAPYILERLDLDCFDAVAHGGEIARSKPDPEVFLLAAQKLGLGPSRCLVVEDAAAGIEAAVRGGFDAAAIGDARTHPGATYCLTSFPELAQFV